ncbi:hypothetical protein [Paraburkholderia hayleyella]|uniref:hypothetical protein n=1 Tax=Paraburkholderia hayleyella TaxID=2152889 RepID=UPI0012918E41|nr:hypothetical protein [Paraburkholderia hayleyella]
MKFILSRYFLFRLTYLDIVSGCLQAGNCVVAMLFENIGIHFIGCSVLNYCFISYGFPGLFLFDFHCAGGMVWRIAGTAFTFSLFYSLIKRREQAGLLYHGRRFNGA